MHIREGRYSTGLLPVRAALSGMVKLTSLGDGSPHTCMVNG
jgi:hypothetical protein